MPSTDLGYMTATLDSTGAPYQEHPIWIGSHDLVISMNGYPNDHPFEVVKGWMSGATVDYSACTSQMGGTSTGPIGLHQPGITVSCLTWLLRT
jgi:hypothetical protein